MCRASFWFGCLVGVGGGHVLVVVLYVSSVLVGNLYEIFYLNLIIDPYAWMRIDVEFLLD